MNKRLLITFSGMDGTGKTTLANVIQQKLKDEGHDVTFIHGHGYTVSQNSFQADEHQVRKLNWFFRLLLPLALLDNYLTYFKYKKQLQTSTVVCDRYFYDKVSRMLFYGIMNRFLAKIYLSLLPKPDYTFILTADPKTVYERKKEYTMEEYSMFKKNYEFIANYLHIPLINTELPQGTCVNKILSFMSKQ